MKKYYYARYVPYLRTRYINRHRSNASVHIRNFTAFVRLIICILCFIATINGICNNFYNAVDNIVEYKASQLVNEYIDNGVLSASALFHDKKFISVGYRNDGSVTSVETNAIEVNSYASIISDNIQKRIKETEHEKIKVPLGSVTGKKLLSSLGLSIPYRIIPASKVSVIPNSVFLDAGMNQTLHQLRMNVTVKVNILFPIISREEIISRDVIVSETVIVGEVPKVLLENSH
ncbi:MAG: sporulation protein YunB [Clostridiaceae bacterium]|jgi:sporulation protein YunB|nr:sporulation protein YunB [Clostridiaceae bacterium]